MRKSIVMSLCLLAVLTIWSFSSTVVAQEVTLRFSDWHLTEDVWNKSLTEGMAIFSEQYPNIKVIMEPVSDRSFIA